MSRICISEVVQIQELGTFDADVVKLDSRVIVFFSEHGDTAVQNPEVGVRQDATELIHRDQPRCSWKSYSLSLLCLILCWLLYWSLTWNLAVSSCWLDCFIDLS
jgi:hypothetical protein